MKTDKKLIELLKDLKPAKLALFTNSIGYMARDVLKQRRVPVKKLFHRVFYSNVIHHAKPAKQAYEFVVKKLKVKSSQALMVDDRKENIQAAKKVGMQGVVFKSAAQFKKQLQKYELE